MPARDIQHETMQLYRTLVDLCDDWGGKLVLLHGTGCVSTGAPPAVSIANGTTLAIDSDGPAMKSAQRAGYLDFVVNSIDEALRALKNEVRQKRPLSVGLIADVQATLAEMAERGVQPDLNLTPDAPERPLPNSSEHFFAAADATALRKIDTALLALILPGDLVRCHWILRAPQFLREARSGGRWIWLSDDELAALAAQGLTPSQSP